MRDPSAVFRARVTRSFASKDSRAGDHLRDAADAPRVLPVAHGRATSYQRATEALARLHGLLRGPPLDRRFYESTLSLLARSTFATAFEHYTCFAAAALLSFKAVERIVTGVAPGGSGRSATARGLA